MPVTPLLNSALPPFVPRFNSVAQVTPFTLRDGSTFLSILRELEKYVTDLGPEMDERFKLVYQAITDLETDWRALFDGFIADVYSRLEEMNRTVVNQFIVEHFNPLFTNPMNPPFNAKFDGVTDDSAAIQAAVNMGGTIMMPRGTAIIQDIAVGSNTRIVGTGIDSTIFKIKDGARWDARGFYTKNKSKHVGFADFTINGNQPNRVLTGGTGGIMGTNHSIVESEYVTVDRVKSVWAVQHCFDVTGDQYYDLGDGASAPRRSNHVSYTDCIAEYFGDDGFTSHGSSHLSWTRCRAGKTWWATIKGYQNCNPFEFDDYSEQGTFTDCYAYEGAHGFEIKAHKTMSAGRNVRLIGCVSEFNEVNYNFRHISHHVNYPGNPAVPSVSAREIQMIGCTSRYPRQVFTGEAGKLVEVRGLLIGAYDGVTITNYTEVGDPNTNYRGSSPIMFHFLARNIVLDGYDVSGYTTSTYDIHATGGTQPASNVTIANGMHRNSAPSSISCGAAAKARVMNVSIERDVAGSPNKTGIRVFGESMVRGNRILSPFEAPYQISYSTYSSYETPLAAIVKIADIPQTPDDDGVIYDPGT